MKYVALLILWLSTVSLVYAQAADSSTFQVRVFGGTDSEAPSTPSLLSASPIASTQIDLTWSTSTDNYSVRGYVVLRGSTTIATTTQTSYSDTGLSASTTYSYAVIAFDYSYNYSSTSNSLSTTTPGFPVTPPDSDEDDARSIQGNVARLVVNNFTINTGVSTTSFTMQTPWATRLSLRWGRTASYELGYVTNVEYDTDHSVLLTDLEPGTTYEYELVGENTFGLEGVIRSGQFTTKELAVPNIPANVGRFTAIARGDDVELNWQMPPNEDVAYVRIVRSHLDFPSYAQDGAIAYQGLQTSIRDENILRQYSPVYYTAFVFDAEGNVSSGAVALVYAQSSSGDTGAVSETDVRQLPPPAQLPEATTTIDVERMTIDMKVPQLSEVAIFQNGRTLTFLDSDIVLNADSSFTLFIPADSVAGNLKTIIGTILDPTNNRQSYSFLLRINKEKTAYEAEIAPLGVEGKTAVSVDIYDYEAAIIATYQAPVTIKKDSPAFADERDTRSSRDFSIPVNYLVFAILPLLLILILFLAFRRRSRN